MSNDSSQPTLADYVGVVIGPALIMALVSSLVYFLVEVFLGPDYPSQLTWILFFFVFGAVLVSRISMTGGIAERAALYGVVLAVLAWIAMKMYVVYPSGSHLADFGWFVNAALVAIVWWSVHCLTWDSTLLDDNQDASGKGLLQSAGLDEPAGARGSVEKVPGKRKREKSGFDGWIERYQRYREEAGKQPHAPGVWVVYFSLAALPLFGLGQALIPVHDQGRRRYAFWLMGIYVASALGLLLTTSFLNLRRYLRHRRVNMPAAMTGMWLVAGVALIALLLVVGAIIPRPNAEYSLLDLRGEAAASERDGSRLGQGRAWSKKGEGNQAGKREGEGDSKGDGEGNKAGEKGGKGKSKDASTDGKSNDPDAKGSGKGGKGKDGKGGDRDGKGQKGEGKGKDGKGGQAKAQAKEAGTPEPSSSQWPAFPEIGQFLANLLKWVVGGVVVLLVTFLVLRAVLRFLANFTNWASGLLNSLQSLWERLAGLWGGRLVEAPLDEPEPEAPPPPYSNFSDPFLTGAAAGMDPTELVRYAFEAMHAWAFERGIKRLPGETPLEFADRLGGEFPGLELTAADVATLYSGVAYARKMPSEEQLETLRPLWQSLEDAAERPMSAGSVS